MNWHQAFMLATAIGLALCAAGIGQERKRTVPSSYYAAFYSAGAASMNEQKLVVFPDDGGPVAIPLPFALGRFAYSPNGTALYGDPLLATRNRIPEGIYKIEFNPTRVSPVLVTGFRRLNSIAVSSREDRLLVSGEYQDGHNRYCGVFEVSLPGGAVRPVLQGGDCKYLSSWLRLSLSPDGGRAVAVHNHRLELIDVARGEAKPLGDGFGEASWSPDGRWIAAIENGGKWRTVLIDANSFSRKKILGTSEGHWSPDSRYLLSMSDRGCGDSETGTIQTLNIETGAKETIASSKCQVYQTTTGWVSSSIVP
jgi:WD40-like Beta Propeller Repeat